MTREAAARFVPKPGLFWSTVHLIRILSWPLFRVAVSPGRHYPPGPWIGVFNHASNLDIVAMAWAVDRPCAFWAKSELSRIPLFGALIRRCGAVFVKRGTRDEAAFAEACQRIKQGLPFYLAPEGTRRHQADGAARAHTGFIRLAQETGASIVPIALSGTREAMPPGALLPRPRKLRLRIGKPLRLPPVTPDVDHREELQAQADAVMREVYRLKEELERGR